MWPIVGCRHGHMRSQCEVSHVALGHTHKHKSLYSCFMKQIYIFRRIAVQNVSAVFSDTMNSWTCASKGIEKAKLRSPAKVTGHCRCIAEMSTHSTQSFVSAVMWPLSFQQQQNISQADLPKLLEESVNIFFFPLQLTKKRCHFVGIMPVCVLVSAFQHTTGER